MNRRKLLYYLFLNALVSACVTGAILFWYDRNIRATYAPLVSAITPAQPSSAAAVVTQSSGEIPVQIASIVGAGTLNAELVVIRYRGDDQLNLAGWQLKDEDGNVFTFPQLILYPNGAVQIHTATGTDTVIDLYWDMPEAIWRSGENARLYDSQGTLQAVYRVP